MLLTNINTSLKSFKIATNDFSGELANQTKYAFRIAPHKDKTNCAFQVLSETNIDFYNGNSIEFNAEVIFFFKYEKPMLMQLLAFAEEAVKQINLLFGFTVNPSRFAMQLSIEPFKENEAVEAIAKELNEVF